MAATVTERFDSREIERGERPLGLLRYSITGEADESLALDALEAAAPATIDGMPLRSWKVTPIGDPIESEAWNGEARYSLTTISGSETPTTGQPALGFSTAGGNVRITQSLQTISNTAPVGFTAPDFGGAVGVNADRVDGVDIAGRSFVWTEVHQIADSAVDLAYQQLLASLTATVNNATFRGYPAGELLLVDVQGQRRTGAQFWDITYRFAQRDNLTAIPVGAIVVPSKLGHEYLWVRYGKAEDQNVLIQRPLSAHVERVYELGDFSLLGI